MAVVEFGSITGVFLMGEIGTDENLGDRPREHCTFMLENVIKKIVINITL
jgi:hypothetical protein